MLRFSCILVLSSILTLPSGATVDTSPRGKLRCEFKFSMQVANVTVERTADGHQKKKMLSPSEEHSAPVLDGTSAPLNFSKLTPCQFGISVQSFTPASSRKGERTGRYFMLNSLCMIFMVLHRQRCNVCNESAVLSNHWQRSTDIYCIFTLEFAKMPEQ